MSTKLKVLYAALILLAVYTLWPSSDPSKDGSANIRVWDAKVNEQGQLDVLGVVLGETSLKEAEAILFTQSERALFVSLKEGKPVKETLEAFFPTSPDRAKIIIELDLSPEFLERIKSRTYSPMVFPSGNVRLQISPEHNAEIDTLVAKSITYVPSLDLTPNMVEQNFGKTDQQLVDVDGNIHLLYPALGLDVVIAREGKPLLQFVPPAEFDRLRSLIHLQEQKQPEPEKSETAL